MCCARWQGEWQVLLEPEEREPKAGTHEKQSPDHLDSRALPAGHLGCPSWQLLGQLAVERLRRPRPGQPGHPWLGPSERAIGRERRRRWWWHLERRLLLEHGIAHDLNDERRRRHDVLWRRRQSATAGHSAIFLERGTSRSDRKGPPPPGRLHCLDEQESEPLCAGGGRLRDSRRWIGDTGAVRRGPPVSPRRSDRAPGDGNSHPWAGAQAVGRPHG